MRPSCASLPPQYPRPQPMPYSRPQYSSCRCHRSLGRARRNNGRLQQLAVACQAWKVSPLSQISPVTKAAGYSRDIRSCWFVLLFRTLPPAAPPASPVAPLRGMIGRVLYTTAVTRPAGPHTDIQYRNPRRQNSRSKRQRRREDTANDPNS